MKRRMLPHQLAKRDLTSQELKMVSGGNGGNPTIDPEDSCARLGTYTTAGCSTRRDDADV